MAERTLLAALEISEIDEMRLWRPRETLRLWREPWGELCLESGYGHLYLTDVAIRWLMSLLTAEKERGGEQGG